LLLLTLPLFAYYLHRQKRNLQSLVVVFLDELVKELKLIKVTANQPATPASVPAAPAPAVAPAAPEIKPVTIRVNLPQLPPEESPGPAKEIPTG